MKPSPASSSRKATNVTIDARLLEQAQSLGINISKASEEGLARAVAAKQEAMWLVSNQAALESSNAYGKIYRVSHLFFQQPKGEDKWGPIA